MVWFGNGEQNMQRPILFGFFAVVDCGTLKPEDTVARVLEGIGSPNISA